MTRYVYQIKCKESIIIRDRLYSSRLKALQKIRNYAGDCELREKEFEEYYNGETSQRYLLVDKNEYFMNIYLKKRKVE